MKKPVLAQTGPTADDLAAYGDAQDIVTQSGGNMAATLEDLARLAQEQLDAEANVAAAQAALTRAQDRLKDVQERRLPEAMENLGMKDFTTTTGLKIVVDETVRSSPPKNMREQAWAWCRANGAAGLVKRTIKLEFGKGEDAIANQILKLKSLQKAGNITDDSGVHPSTLSAFVKTKLAEGVDIPVDVFGIFKQRVSKIVKPK